MTKAAKQTSQATGTRLPAKPRDRKVEVATMHQRIAKRFPKVLAELAK